MEIDSDLYALLGLARSCTLAEIRRAYRRLARELHPDVNHGPRARERFQEITLAHEVLTDAKRRHLYDEYGAASLRPGFDAGRAQQARAKPQAANSAAWTSRAQGTAQPGGDVEVQAEVELTKALRGGEIAIEVPTGLACGECGGSGAAQAVCPACEGSGVQEPVEKLGACLSCNGAGRLHCAHCRGAGRMPGTRRLVVRIPPGVEQGGRLRVPGQGHPGLFGGRSGDLFVMVQIPAHPFLRREGLDLHLRLPVRLDEAYLGSEIEIPTLTSPVKLSIPPLSQNGQKLRLRGLGVRRKSSRGDLYVELDVRLPDRMESELAASMRASQSGYSKPVREDLAL